MPSVVETITINRPADDIWKVLADFGAIAQWAPNVDHSCVTTAQHDGVGAARRVQLGRNTLVETIESWEPTTQLSYRIDGLPPLLRSVSNAWSIAGDGDRSTVTLTTSVDTGPRPPQKLIGRGAARLLARASRDLLAGLKTHLEAEAS